MRHSKKLYILMLLFILLGLNGATIAQTTDKEGKKVSHIGRWVGFFMVYSGYEFSDQFNLEKLAGPIAGELLQDASFNPELIYMLDQFQQDHFLTIYPVPVYNGPDKAVIHRLNEVSLQFHDPRNDPYLNLFIYLDTLSGRQFKLSLAFHSPVDQIGLPEINSAANQRLQSLVFNTMQESTAKTNEVIAWALGEIAKKAGDTFHPPFYVQYKDNVYRNGNIIEVWQDERTEFQAFKKINGSYQSTYSGWRGEYLTGNGAYAWYEPTEPGQLPIMVIHETDTLRLQVLAKPGTGVPNLREIVRTLLKEALAAKRQQLQGSLDSLRNDSTSLETTLGQQIARLERGNVAMEDDGGQMKMLFDQPVVIEDSALFKRSAEREKGFELIRKRKNIFHQIISKVNIEAFIDLAVDDPEKLKLLTDDLLSNSGTLLAQLLVGKDNQGDRAQALDIVFRYVNQNIERLANAQPMSLPAYAIRPIVVPPVEEITPDYSKRLYINENVVFEGKDQFVKEIEDYLSTLETPTIVTINYSQDENSEGYVSRAKAGRPKGLPEGYDYISILLVNIPGSVGYDMVLPSDYESDLGSVQKNNVRGVLTTVIKTNAVLNRVDAIVKTIAQYVADGITPGTRKTLPWYGGESSMHGYVIVGDEKIKCLISLNDGKTTISDNKITFTVPDFKTYFRDPNSGTLNRYYKVYDRKIVFEEIEIDIKQPFIESTWKEKTRKVLNHIAKGCISSDPNLIANLNKQYKNSKTNDEKENVIKTLLGYSLLPTDYAGLSVELRLAVVKFYCTSDWQDKLKSYIKFLPTHKLSDRKEQELLFLMDNIKDDDINLFLKGLESTTVNSVSLAIILIKEYQDALIATETTIGDRNYYTSLVQVFIKLALKDKERVKKLATYDAAKTIKLGYIPLWKNRIAGDLRYTTELSNTTIKIQEECTFIEREYHYGPDGTRFVDAAKWRSIKEPLITNPFDLVILDDQSQLSWDMLRRVYEGQMVLDGLKAVPAIVINYVNDKAFNKKVEQISYIAIDVISIATGVGELTLAVKLLSNSRKIYIALDILNATANIAVNTSDLQDDPTVQKWLGYYNAATLFTNFASIYSSGRNIAKGAGRLDEIFDAQTAVIIKNKNKISSMSNNHKGAFGEIASDVYLTEKGFQPLHPRKSALTDGWGEKGIDGVFVRDGQFYIVEAKYTGFSVLKMTDDGLQMSDPWITGGNRILDAVSGNRTLADEILTNNYKRILAEVAQDGSVIYKELNASGKVISIFNP